MKVVMLRPLLAKHFPVKDVCLDQDLSKKLRQLYSNDYPVDIKERFEARNGKDLAIQEACDVWTFKNICITLLIGMDVTNEDIRNESGFYTSKGKGPVLLRKILDFILGGNIVQNKKLYSLFKGVFRDLWEVVPDKANETDANHIAVIKWLKIYLETLNPACTLAIGEKVFNLFALGLIEKGIESSPSIYLESTGKYREYCGISSVFQTGDGKYTIVTPTFHSGCHAYQ